MKRRPIKDEGNALPGLISLAQDIRAMAFLLGIILCLWPGSAFCGSVRSGNEDLFALGIGFNNIKDNMNTGALRIEYLSDKRLWKFIPYTGLIITTDTALYGYAGVGLEFWLTPNWLIIPRFAAGFYYHITGKDLGNPIEFFSNLELAYRFKDRSRLGLSLGHLSNSGIGQHNPGTESLFLAYTVPLEYLLCHFRTD
jgi:lipid A 3-O-deacylase